MKNKNDINEIHRKLCYIENCAELTSDKKDRYKVNYYQLANAFDIETTSFIENGKKYASMYCWQFCINGLIIIGRTWYDFTCFIQILHEIFHRAKLVVYVHNLSYEFQWVYGWLDIQDVFARRQRAVMKFDSDNITFKCSYFLSGYSLARLAQQRGYEEKKKLDYKKMRFWFTPLNDDEIRYNITDVYILYQYITEEIEKNGLIEKIPLTQTGYTRRYCIDEIGKETSYFKFHKDVVKKLPDTPELFTLLNKCYSGGFTHANFLKVRHTLKNVSSYDFTSHYPAIMCRKKFPQRFIERDKKTVNIDTTELSFICEIEFTNIEATTPHSIISSHKCSYVYETALIDNGRIRKAEKLTAYITDLDYKIYKKFYKWENADVKQLYTSVYVYLPKELIKAVLNLYKNKTELKGVDGKEDEYLHSKELINSVYGMSVTNPMNDTIIFDIATPEKWLKESPEIEDGLKDYLSRFNVFTTYQMGVYITAWARYELLNMVYKVNNDCVYCDTDSMKILNNEKWQKEFKKDNQRIIEENKKAIEHFKIDENLFFPKTIDGIIKPLGIWEFEGNYKFYKTLGAKRYIYEDEKGLHATIAGLPKKSAVEYLLKHAKKESKSPFDVFNNQMHVEAEESGKNLLTYIDKPFSMSVTDYIGNTGVINEKSYIYMSETEFSLKMSKQFLDLLKGINNNKLIAPVSEWQKQQTIERIKHYEKD